MQPAAAHSGTETRREGDGHSEQKVRLEVLLRFDSGRGEEGKLVLNYEIMKNSAHPEPEVVLPRGPLNDDSVPHPGAPLLGPHMESLSQTTRGYLVAIPFPFSVT